MSDITESQQSEVTRITGGDEAYTADVIEEDGAKKLLVKSSIVPQVLGNRFTYFAENLGSRDLNIDGSVTPVEFIINADVVGDLVVNSLIFEAFAGGIKIDKFLSLNASLTNGILIEVKSSDTVFQFEPIKNTIEFDSLFANGAGRSYEIVDASGNDSMVARFGPQSPFLIKKQGSFVIDDYIKVIIRDDIDSVNSLRFLAEGSVDT